MGLTWAADNFLPDGGQDMGRNVRSDDTGARGVAAGHAGEVIKTIAANEGDASRLLEMYYWTREPGIVDLIRAYLELPERAQRQLGGFLRKYKPQSIITSIDEQGRLVMTRVDGRPLAQRAKRSG